MELLKILRYLLCMTIAFCFCDRSVDIPINNKDETKLVHFSCGSVTFSASTLGGHLFSIDQKYKLSKEIYIYPESLHVWYKEKYITTTLYDEDGKIIKKSPYVFSDNRGILLGFDIEEELNKGDTIIVIPNGYLYCLSERVLIDTINMIVNKDFR